MSIHIDREDFLQGSTAPTSLVPEFIGQTYIDTTHEILYINYNGRSDGWVQQAVHEHYHLPSEIIGLEDYIDSTVDQGYITQAVQTIRTTGNQWTGLNNFTTLRRNGVDVLTKTSALEDLGNVVADLSNATPGQVLGWNGSAWALYNPDGTLPGGGGYDFTNFVLKNNITSVINSTSTTDVLSAAGGKAIVDYVTANFSEQGHIHSDYSLASHTHADYLSKASDNQVEGNIYTSGQLNFSDSEGTSRPISFSADGGDMSFKIAVDEDDHFKINVDGKANGKQSLYIGGDEDNTAKELILNFETVRIPSGRIVTNDSTGRIIFSPIKIENALGSATKYVGGGYAKDYGLNLNNTSMVGVNQIAFARSSMGQSDSILFPKSFAGNTQPTDSGMYNYLYLLDDQMYTDAALGSTKNYIELAGKRIFFSPVQPGKEARPGDVWIKV